MWTSTHPFKSQVVPTVVEVQLEKKKIILMRLIFTYTYNILAPVSMFTIINSKLVQLKISLRLKLV